MSKHLYLRAYMAGIVVPTLFLLVGMVIFCIARYVYNVPIPIERVVVFPMAVVPNLWGAWNMLYVLLQSRRYVPVGFHGAILPFLIAPIGFVVAKALDIVTVPPAVIASAFPVAVVVYYLAWKYLVGFFNKVLGIA